MKPNALYWLHSAHTWISLSLMPQQPDIPNCIAKFDDAVRELLT
jgi:hypothetical protein